MNTSYIAIYDNTNNAKYLYASEGVQEFLGYSPTELLSIDSYSLTHPDERNSLRLIHNYSNAQQSFSFWISYHLRHKDGHYVRCNSILHWCHDLIIATVFGEWSELRASSVEERFIVHPNGQMESNIQIPQNDTWSTVEPEPRFCLILNRYSEQALIVFATRQCEEIGKMNQIECVGQSVLEFVAPEHQAIVKHHLELVKSSEMIVKFPFLWHTHILMEAVMSCTVDGLVMVIRHANKICHHTIPS